MMKSSIYSFETLKAIRIFSIWFSMLIQTRLPPSIRLTCIYYILICVKTQSEQIPISSTEYIAFFQLKKEDGGLRIHSFTVLALITPIEDCIEVGKIANKDKNKR